MSTARDRLLAASRGNKKTPKGADDDIREEARLFHDAILKSAEKTAFETGKTGYTTWLADFLHASGIRDSHHFKLGRVLERVKKLFADEDISFSAYYNSYSDNDSDSDLDYSVPSDDDSLYFANNIEIHLEW